MITDGFDQSSIRALFCDNSLALTSAMAQFFEADEQIEFHACCTDSLSGANFPPIPERRFDIVILDPSQTTLNPVKALQQMRDRIGPCEGIAYLPESAKTMAYDCMKSGYSGVVSRSAQIAEFSDAVHAVASGGIQFDGRFGSPIAADDEIPPGTEMLSSRERQVIRKLAAGKVCKEIGEELSISGKTVETYKARGMSKLGLTNVAALAEHARANVWLE